MSRHDQRNQRAGTGNAFVDEQFDRLQAAIRSVMDFLAEPPARRTIAAVRAILAVADPGIERIAVNKQSGAEGWHIRMFRAMMPGVEDTASNRSAFIRETHPLRRTLWGPQDTFERYAMNDPERERRRKKDRRPPSDRVMEDPCMFTLLLGLERAARAADRFREISVKKAATANRVINRDAAKRERARAADLRRAAADIAEAARRSRDAAEADRRRRGDRTAARIGTATQVTALDARIEDLRARVVYGRTREEHVAYESASHLASSWRDTASRRHDRVEREAKHLGGVATDARSRADALKTHREAIVGSWSGAANPGGAVGYLARLRKEGTEDPRVVASIQTALRRAHGSQVSASCAERSERRERDDGAATEVDDQAIAQADNRSWYDRIRPQQHRTDKRRAWREKKLADGTAEPPKFDAMPDAEADVMTPMRRAAEKKNKEILTRMRSVANTAMTDSGWWREMRHDGELRASRIVGGPGASLIFASPGVDTSSPMRMATTFLDPASGSPKPRVCMRRQQPDGTWKRGRLDHRLSHFVLSLPRCDYPDGMISDQAFLGAAFARLAIIGVDPARHRCMVMRHDDDQTKEDGKLHIHVLFDRVRDDGRVWDISGMDMVAAVNASTNLVDSLFLSKMRDPQADEPVHYAAVARRKKDANGNEHSNVQTMSLAALAKLAKGRMRCELKWQDADPDTGDVRYDAPMHGHDADGTKDPDRVVCGKNAIRRGLVLAGHAGLLPGFSKIDDVGRDTAFDDLEHEKTTNDPGQQKSWRFLSGPERAVRMWEHLMRILAENCG